MNNKDRIFNLMEIVPPQMSDVKTLDRVNKTSPMIVNANKRIDSANEFYGSFEVWFKTLGLTPQKISKGKIKSDIDKILTNLGYR